MLKCARGRLILHGLGSGQAFEYAAMLKHEYLNDPDILSHVTVLENDIRHSSRDISVSKS